MENIEKQDARKIREKFESARSGVVESLVDLGVGIVGLVGIWGGAIVVGAAIASFMEPGFGRDLFNFSLGYLGMGIVNRTEIDETFREKITYALDDIPTLLDGARDYRNKLQAYLNGQGVK